MTGEARIGGTIETGPPSRPERNESPGHGMGSGMSRGFVITLLSSIRPLDDVAARLLSAEFGTAFCARHIVDGHAHYRLQLGPFMTMDSAAQALKVARRIFPRAVIRAADGIRRAGNGALAHTEVPQAARPARDDESWRTSGSAGEATRPVAKGDSAVTTSEVIEIPDAQRVTSKLYAVELLWSPSPLDLAHVPPLTLFDERTLYAVSVRRASHLWYGLRVGFYRDGHEARRAATELVGYFEGAIAVPATEQEFAHARAAEIRAWAARIDASVVVPA
jgi:hypothetical protein